MTPFYMDFYYKTTGLNGCMMHDPAAVVACVHPELFIYEDVPLCVTTDGEKIGQTRPYKAAHQKNFQRQSVKVATSVLNDKVKQVYFETLSKGE